MPEGLCLYASPEGETPYDAFVSDKFNSVDELPQGAVVGTSSLRRKLQPKRLRPDLQIKDLRGNVNTRLSKMEAGEYDAIILAKAGLVRLEFGQRVRETFTTEQMLPACCQGVLGIQIREGDERVMKMLDFLRDKETETKVKMERAFLRRLEGGCQAPIAGHSVMTGERFCMKGIVADLDGETFIEQIIEGRAEDAEKLGLELAEKVLDAGARSILEEIYKDAE